MTAYRDAVSALGARQKSQRGVSLYSRFVNRPLGRLVAAAAHTLGLSPNLVSLLSAVVTLAGVAVLALVPPTWWSGVLVWQLLAWGFVLDSADGQVARLQSRSSPGGEWLDHVIDAGKMVVVHAGVLVGWYRFTDLSDGLLLVPLFFQLVAVVMFAGLTIVALLKRVAGVTRSEGQGGPSWVRAVGLLPADYGIQTLFFVLWGAVGVFAAAYTLLAVVNAVLLVLLSAKWWGELRALAGPQG
ncbi:CDP-alcohol phosphatidyltransferase family protein [Nocardioides aurantiacus]|uniref:Phosphatidylglycerophosphate synthase n=1 Tax=Nocardioides aurantiacus TaxID=86796 RepID=A0A3N2CSI2_9ACTN|nr:CDP-alcohol phosphatidyltransferase family protein [Nocardioides aurantiacus]ROR90501.1 phosphatidylglycerophosphate synthase [Nocardioides aurantiacus]